MNYGFAAVDSAMNPVDLCYLISTTDASGNRVQNGYPYAMGVVTDYIISFLAKETSGFTLQSHIANLNSIKEGIHVQHGANVDYHILGASVAEMPLSEIATYLGCMLFENYKEMYQKVPAEKERDEFLVKMRLQYEDILKEISHGCAASITFGKAYDAKMYDQGGDHAFIKRAEQYLSDNIGILEKNAKTMMEDLGEKYGVDYLTIQSGGTLNNELVRQGLVDYVHVVIAPLLVGGKSTNTLLDGKAISSVAELGKLKALELLEVNQLENSYLELKYRVKNEKEG